MLKGRTIMGRHFWMLAVSILAIVLLFLSWTVGPYIFVPFAFIIPVALAAWHVGRWPALLLGLLLAIARLILVLLVWEPPGFTPPVALINCTILCLVLSGFAWSLDLASKAYALSSRLRSLEGMLSICAYCKKIHRTDGDWEQIESYIGKHSDTSFSHGICPECAHRFFPEVYQRQDRSAQPDPNEEGMG